MKTVEQFPMLNAAVSVAKSQWQRKSLVTVLQAINNYTESIPNPIFKDAKDALNKVVECAREFDGLYSETFRAAYRFEGANLDFYSAAHAAGKLKLAAKKGFNDATWVATLNEIVVLHEALDALKSKVVKRAVRSEEERADDYVPPMPTTAVAVKITGILKTMTDELTAQYATILHNHFVTSVESYKPLTRAEKNAMRPYYTPCFVEAILMSSIGENWDSINGNYTTLKADWKAILLKKAEADADFAQRMFLYKNVTKLAVILEAKGDFNHQIIDGRVNGAGFQGEIVFTFADNTRFTVRNKVIVNVSAHGRAFNQFPTTFHDVTGLQGQPSQEDMIEIFGGQK